MFFNRLYSLHKCRQILKQTYATVQKKGSKLPEEKRAKIDRLMKQADQAILNSDKEEANRLIKEIEEFSKENVKKSMFEYTLEMIGALAFALIVATIVRQMWFEPYEIPTGSMRPTFREKDRLTVSKTTFGINVPLQTKHFYFDPALVQRTGVLIFSADKIPLPDTEGTYFWIFPAYKRYIKRLIGKPGDTIYFYGGLLYGVDKEGKPLLDLINAPWMARIDHIPFLDFRGEVTDPSPNEIVFHQMNQPIGRIVANPFGEEKGEVFDGKKWVLDRPTNEKHDKIQTYSDVYGMGNFAMARLLTKDELSKVQGLDTSSLEEGILYLELSHHPSLTYPRPLFYQTSQGVTPLLNPLKSIIPLQQHHLDAIMDNLYTARFDVENGRAKRYEVDHSTYGASSPQFPGVPNGRYEFYYGKAEKINWQGIPSKVSKDNPLYSHSPSNVQKLFNLGIEMNTFFQPTVGNPNIFPHRYAYFRNGDLYLMGAPIIKKGEPILKSFLEKEESRAAKSSAARPYTPFKDYGPPLKSDGSYDVEKIRTFGVHVPEGHYFVLGDNHAMSADSRVFGFVPQSNIEGAPSLILWPPGERIGAPAQKPYPFMNLPRAIIWGIALIVFLIWLWIYQRNRQRPIVK
jgi:signal peptidase I